MRLLLCIMLASLQVAGCLLPTHIFAQHYGSPDGQPYPQDYFRPPLDIPIFLAGNFGECRPGHFHSGIDIKTLGKENQPVHAAADGYISRIKMEKGGFGHALYITHPNGYTTLYAHLNKFVPAIQSYVRNEQYKRKRWDVDINLTPDVFPVKQGDQIAWSGNTGASTAPHLHFEIRNTKTEHPLNPELFGLPIVDTVPPVPAEIVFYGNDSGSIYSTRKAFLSLEKKDGVYKPAGRNPQPLPCLADGDTVFMPVYGTGIGINVNDYMNGSDNTLAFYTAKLFLNDSLLSEVTLDDIGYDESRYINAYVDYPARQEEHKWVQLLFKLPGNRLGIYSNLGGNDGRLPVKYEAGQNGKRKEALKPGERWVGESADKITVVITDDKGNESRIAFYAVPVFDVDLVAASEFVAGKIRFQYNRQNDFKNDEVAFSLDDRQLYDNCWFSWNARNKEAAWSNEEHIGSPDVPVHHYFDLSIKPGRPIPTGLKDKIAMIYTDGHDTDGRAAVAGDDNRYHARVRAFGTYWLDVDTVPPVIKSLQKNGANLSKAERIIFEVKDAMTSISSFSGYLDGRWICFEAHEDKYFYEFDEHCPKGKHELIFKAADENGNTRVYKLRFTR